MKSSQFKGGETVLLTEDHVYFGGMSLSYQLLIGTEKCIRHFYIRIQKSEEQEIADVGTDLFRAIRWYQSIVDGTVTPCTLAEVLEDLQYA